MEFDPTRFSKENESKLPPGSRYLGGYCLLQGAFIPFSFGPRNCIGKRLAIQQLLYTAAVILHNFDLELVEEPKYCWNRFISLLMLRFLYVFITEPVNGIQVRISPR